MFQAKNQNRMAQVSQSMVNMTPQNMLMLIRYPIKKGEGKSPKRCMKNMAMAFAWPLSCEGTQLMREIATGPLFLDRYYMYIRNRKNHMKTLK